MRQETASRHKAMEGEEVTKAVSAMVKERFSDAAIESVSVQPDFDSDGDPILRVVIVFTTREEELDRTKMVGLARHLRSKLDDLNAEGFPLVSFVSMKDALKHKREVA